MVNKEARKINGLEAIFASVTNKSTRKMAIQFLYNIGFTGVKIKENYEGQILPLNILVYIAC